MSRTTLIKWPTRSRPGLVLQRLPLWAADPSVRFLFTVDADDESCNNSKFLAAVDAVTGGRAKVRIGNCRSKVQACNDGLTQEEWGGIVILASDDMVPQRPDYAARIAELFADRFPGGYGVLHLNDGRTGPNLNTLCICDWKYFYRFGYLYHPSYYSLWCDNEWQEVSERLGRAAYVDEVIIRHQWIGHDRPDELHRRNESFYDRDCEVFKSRKAAGFPIQPLADRKA